MNKVVKVIKNARDKDRDITPSANRTRNDHAVKTPHIA